MADNIEITQDQNNFNKHSQFGMSLLEKSMRKFGFVEAGVLSEDNVICGGNARNEVAEDIGIIKKRIIDIDGNEQVFLRRKGLKSGTEEFHELALALNAVPKANIVFAEEVLAETLTAEVCEAWGVKLQIEPSSDELIGEEKNKPPTLKITFESPEQLQKAEIDIQELIDRKYNGAYFSVSAGEL